MRKQPYPMTQLTGGLDVSIDPIFLMDRTSPNLRNIRLHKSMIRKELGWKQFSASGANGLPLDSEVMLIDSFPMANGTSHAVFVTANTFYSYDSDDEEYTSRMPANTSFTSTLDNPYSATITVNVAGTEVYVITNGVDPVYYWTGAANLAELSGWEGHPIEGIIRPRQIIHFKNRLICGGGTESGKAHPRRVRWSVLGNPNDANSTGSGYVDLYDTTDWITAFVIMKDRLFIVKERSIWELEYVGGDSIFTPALKVDGVGSYSPHGVISLDEEMIFYGSDNVYTFDGFSLKPMGGQIYSYLYEALERRVNASMAPRFPAAYIEELKLFMMCLTQKFGTVPDLVYKYDYDYDAWTTVEREMTAIGYWGTEGTGTTLWNELTDDWDELDWVWLSRNLAPGAPTTLIGDSNGYIYEDDRLTTSTDHMMYETKDFIFEHAVRWVEFRIQAKYGPFRVSYSIDGGATWSNAHEFGVVTQFTEFSWLLNITSQKIRFRIECDAESLDIKWIEPWYVLRKRSKILVTS